MVFLALLLKLYLCLLILTLNSFLSRDSYENFVLSMQTNTHTYYTLKEHRTEAENKELFKSQIGFRLFPFFPCLLKLLLLLPSTTTTITTIQKRNKNYFSENWIKYKKRIEEKMPASMEEMNENIAD